MSQNATNNTSVAGAAKLCPILQPEFPGATHTMVRGIGADRTDFWTTTCHHCGEVPACDGHDWQPTSRVINGEPEYLIECQNCGWLEITTEQSYLSSMAWAAVSAARANAAPLRRRAVVLPKDVCERPYKLYKILITEVPEACDDLGWKFDPEVGAHRRHRNWKPVGWEEYVRARIIDGATWSEDQHFFWPSETKTYRSRSTAADKVATVERWGGKAIILEAQVGAFTPLEEANRRRKEVRNEVRIKALQDKIQAIQNS